MSGDSDILRIMEVVLTAEIFNQNPQLEINDLTPACREIFAVTNASEIKRPVYVSDGVIRRTLNIADAHLKLACKPVCCLRGIRSADADNGHLSRQPSGSSSRAENPSSVKTRCLHSISGT